MEVHSHSHTPRKKWTHYLWEFLMLFLAVFCGFLAENQREHMVEHQREKKFAKLLCEDFKKDTALINKVLMVKEFRKKKLDSLFYFFALRDLQSNAAAIYYYSYFVNPTFEFAPSDATIQQLRSSGSLRYFSNLQLYNAITTYYLNCGWYKDAEEANKKNTIQITTAIAKIFQAEQFYSLLSINDPLNAIRYPNIPVQLLTIDKLTINEFLVQAKQSNFYNDGAIIILKYIKTQLENLIDEIKEEYHFQ